MTRPLEIATAKFQFKEALKQKLRVMSPGRRKNWKPPKPAVWLFPSGQQRKYYKRISNLQKKITDPATERIRDRLQSWIKDYRGDSIREDQTINISDAYTDDLKFTVEELRKELEGLEENQRIMITNIGFDTGEFNKSQWKKYTTGLLGYEFITEELWERDVINAWADTNFELIKSLSNEYIKKVNTIVSEGVQFGRTYDEIMHQIVKEKKLTEGWQSMRIARDQVGKLNGRFTERRQTEVGIDMYTWSNVGDRRVRGNPGGAFPKAIPSHWNNAIGDKLCRWDDDSVYSDDEGRTWKKRTALMPISKPGYEILCRCTAVPWFDDIVAEAKSEVEEEDRLKR